MIAAAGPVLDLPEHLVEVECGRLLTRREPHESLDLLCNEPLHSVQQVGVGDHPVPVGVRVFVRPLERVAAQNIFGALSFTKGSNQHISCLARCSMSTI